MNGEPQYIVGEITRGNYSLALYILLSVDREKQYCYLYSLQTQEMCRREIPVSFDAYEKRWSLL